ncbi:MAG: AI-2E family transporter, partial [Candidatus Liptonbacteria bacterium]|nr:AI-2E family transporter [Candidatus Liptonbacteria bacterium]
IALSAEVANPGVLAIYVIIMFIIIQQLESDVLVPTLMNKAVGLHPVAVLVSLLIGAKFFGLIGILLAVPASVFIQEFIEDWSIKKTRHNRLV